MDKVFQGPARFAVSASPRFSLGRTAAGSGLMACLWLWTAAGALAAGNGKTAPADTTAYRGALESFNRGDDARALAQLEHAPAGGTPKEQADVHNLRGAIYLREGRYDQAQAAFARAASLDHSLWAARFNEAEVSFRQQHYAESRRQFAALLDGTNRLFHPAEHRFVQYKLLLAGVCAGDDKPAQAFIADHRDDAQPPLAWYYLNAALEHRHGHAQKAEQWVAQADSTVGAGASRTYAESFERLGWGNSGLPARSGNATRNVAIADNTVTRTPPTAPRPRASDTNPDEATVAVVEILPDPPAAGARPHGRPGTSEAAPTPADSGDALPSVVDLPPGADDPAAAFAEILRTGRDNGPVALARTPRKGTGKASPSPSPSASPDGGVTANQGGTTPAASASPASSPSAEFTEKYEAAYVKFLEKNYPETISLLDEADKIQPGQGQSVTLRFKSYYALAYLAYRKQDYPGALAQLDHADQTQKNADSFNLRGLIFSKQHNYDQAEAMFHKAVVTDPALWAAKFNYAELPFNRGNYTDARTRFEELFSQTDAAKQPREAELTQYKVFLTLLLEGKVDAASTFMDHLNFSGATPARYFCNAALNFRAGSVDRAKNWIDDAKKEYPPQLVAIFIESFYRLGWMADPNAPPGTMVAQATPAGTPAVTTSGTQPTTVATATAAPTATPAASAFPTPIIVAVASPTPTPLGTPAPFKPSPAVAAASPSATLAAVPTPAASVRPTASATPAIAVATPSPTPTASARPTASATPAIVVATPTPAPTASASPAVVVVVTPPPTAAPTRPAVVVATPTPTAAPTRPAFAFVTPSATPSATASPVVAATTPAATPARSVALASATPTATPRASATAPAVVLVPTPKATPVHTPTPTVVARATPEPSATPVVEAAATQDQQAGKKKQRRRFVVLVLVLGQAIYYVSKMSSVLARRKQREMRAAARRRETAESSK